MKPQKGIVLQVDNYRATILTEDGEYRNILKSGPLYIGQEISLNNFNLWKYAAVAAIFLVVLVASLDFFTVTAYARLSSGVEVGINRWERVVFVRPINSEGLNLIKGLDLQGQKVETAMSSVWEAAQKDQEADKPLTISISHKGAKNQQNERDMVEQITREILKGNGKKVILTRSASQVTIEKSKNDKAGPSSNKSHVKDGNKPVPDNSSNVPGNSVQSPKSKQQPNGGSEISKGKSTPNNEVRDNMGKNKSKTVDPEADKPDKNPKQDSKPNSEKDKPAKQKDIKKKTQDNKKQDQ